MINIIMGSKKIYAEGYISFKETYVPVDKVNFLNNNKILGIKKIRNKKQNK